ncbi:hypothetical protein TNCV_1509971 [Trichonephila clavipes]|nr:hypothetical protein TNCV_1509971 [Trichonephila clavipes]
MTRTTPELAPPLLTTIPHHGRTFELSTDLPNIAPLQGGSSDGTRLELVTRRPRVRYLDQTANAAKGRPHELAANEQ